MTDYNQSTSLKLLDELRLMHFELPFGKKKVLKKCRVSDE